MYMMPIHFGPMCGPRQGPGGKKFAFNPDKRKITHLSVSFLTNANQLQKILPPGFELSGDPVVTVFETFMKIQCMKYIWNVLTLNVYALTSFAKLVNNKN